MAIIHDLKVKLKAVITETELLDPEDSSKPPKRESGQKKYVIDDAVRLPFIQVPADELITRLADMMKCYLYGYRADPLQIADPPKIETDDASSVAATTATLNGRITGALCTAGFKYGLTRELGSTVVATGSPTGVQTTIKSLTYAAAGLTTKTKYYFRVFGQTSATGNTQYGIIRSFTTL